MKLFYQYIILFFQCSSGASLLFWRKWTVWSSGKQKRNLASMGTGPAAKHHGYLPASLPCTWHIPVLLWSHALQETHPYSGWVYFADECSTHSRIKDPVSFPLHYSSLWSLCHMFFPTSTLFCHILSINAEGERPKTGNSTLSISNHFLSHWQTLPLSLDKVTFVTNQK